MNKKSIGNIFLQIVEHPSDGSISRPPLPTLPSDADPSSPVLSKDIPLNQSLRTTLRLFLPNPPPSAADNRKLPVVVYFHGGGFILFSPDFSLYHLFCQRMALSLPALVVSLDYRLAPEHRLPAAYDDAVEAIHWAQHSDDPWIKNHADPSRCFVIGSSCGGNMAYFAGLREANSLDISVRPLSIRGLVLIQPYFGGERRTRSEMELEDDDILPLRANEMMWRLALPEGAASRDHEYCNPVACPPPAHEMARMPATMVIGCKGDPLFDRQRMFVDMFREAAPGVRLVARLDGGDPDYHAVELFDEAKAQHLLSQIREFVVSV